MTWLWAVFTFLNVWWVCAFIVIAFHGQRTDRLKKTLLHTSIFAALLTAVIALLMGQGIISFI